MTKKTKKIVKPVIILAVAICLVLVFTSVPQVKSFFGGVAYVPAESLAGTAAATVDRTKPFVLMTVSPTEVHPGDKMTVSVTYDTKTTSSRSIKSYIAPVDGSSLLATVGGNVLGFMLGVIVNKDVGAQVTGGITTVSLGSGRGSVIFGKTWGTKAATAADTVSDVYPIQLLSFYKDKPLDVTNPGIASKTVYVGAIMEHKLNDGKDTIVSDAETKSRTPVVISNTVAIDADKDGAVNEGNKINLTIKKVGNFSDFGGFDGLVQGSATIYTIPGDDKLTDESHPKEKNVSGNSYVYVVPAFSDLPDPIQTDSISGSLTKTFKIMAAYAFKEEADSKGVHTKLKVSTTETFTVTVPKPTLSISANPTNVASGGMSTLSWSSDSMSSCQVLVYSGKNVTKTVSSSMKGAVLVKPDQTTDYTFKCTGDDKKTYLAQATVYVGTSDIGLLHPHNDGKNGEERGHECNPSGTTITNQENVVQYLTNPSSDPYCNISSYEFSVVPVCAAFVDGGSPFLFSKAGLVGNMEKENDKYTGIKILPMSSCSSAGSVTPPLQNTYSGARPSLVGPLNPNYHPTTPTINLPPNLNNTTPAPGNTTPTASGLPAVPANPTGSCVANANGVYTATFSWSKPTSGSVPAKYTGLIDDLANDFKACSPTNTPNAGDKCLSTLQSSPYTFSAQAGHTYNAIVYSQDASGNSNWTPASATIKCSAGVSTPAVTPSALPSAPSNPVGYCLPNGSGGYNGYFAWSAPTSGPAPAKYSAIIDDTSNGFVACSPTNTPNAGDKCLTAPASNPYYFNGVVGHTYNAIAYSQDANGNSNWTPTSITFTCSPVTATPSNGGPVASAPLTTAPTNPIGSCVANTDGTYSASFSWTAPTSAAPTGYTGGVRGLSPAIPWSNNCPSVNAGNYCINQAGTTFNFRGAAGQSYSAWVYAMNGVTSNWQSAYTTIVCR